VPRDGALTLADVRSLTLSVVCECGRCELYAVARLVAEHGDAKIRLGAPQQASHCVNSRRKRRFAPRLTGPRRHSELDLLRQHSRNLTNFGSAPREPKSVRTSKTGAGDDGDSAMKLDCHKIPRAVALYPSGAASRVG
jgi:hypothetical protein